MQADGHTHEHCQALAEQLVAERLLLINAWEQLEAERRELQSIQPALPRSQQAGPPQYTLPASAIVAPKPAPAATESFVSKKDQFQYLQAEINHRFPRP